MVVVVVVVVGVAVAVAVVVVVLVLTTVYDDVTDVNCCECGVLLT